MKKLLLALIGLALFAGGFYLGDFNRSFDHAMEEKVNPTIVEPQRNMAVERAGLDAFSTKWATAYGAGDFESMRDLYEPDAWLMTRNQPARKGVDAILEYFAESREAGSKATISFEDEDGKIDGNYAFKVAKWWLESPQAIGEPVQDSGRSLVIFKRGNDGVWRLWRDIDNNTPDVNFDNKPDQ